MWRAGLELGGLTLVALPCGIVAREGLPGSRATRCSPVLVGRARRRGRDRAALRHAPVRRDHRERRLFARRRLRAVVLQQVHSQRAVTHTQALAGAYRAGGREGGIAGVVDAAAQAVAEAETWAASLCWARLAAGGDRGRRRRGVGGGARAGAMLKEISRIPAEGVETREGATSAMFGPTAGPDGVARPRRHPLGDEAARLCAAAGRRRCASARRAGGARLAPS